MQKAVVNRRWRWLHLASKQLVWLNRNQVILYFCISYSIYREKLMQRFFLLLMVKIQFWSFESVVSIIKAIKTRQKYLVRLELSPLPHERHPFLVLLELASQLGYLLSLALALLPWICSHAHSPPLLLFLPSILFLTLIKERDILNKGHLYKGQLLFLSVDQPPYKGQ